MKEDGVKGKMELQARSLRLVSRRGLFQQRRRTFDQLDYLRFYSEQDRKSILESLQGELPEPLPPLGPGSISYYRRKGKAVFATRPSEGAQLDGHMTYESLWLLGSLEESAFEDWPVVQRQFERDLGLYLSAASGDIREMAGIAAGNKIIGRQEQVLALVRQDPRQLWVLANHVFENRISFRKLLTFLLPLNEFVLQTVFEVSMLQEEAMTGLLDDQQALGAVLSALGSVNEAVRKFGLRILGNLLASREEHASVLLDLQLLPLIEPCLGSSSAQLRRDACWVLSNLSARKAGAQAVAEYSSILPQLLALLASDPDLKVRREAIYVLCYVAHFGDRRTALGLLCKADVLDLCHASLLTEDPDLELAALRLLRQLLQVGDSFRYEEGRNLALQFLLRNSPLCSEVTRKSYSENSEVSTASQQVVDFWEAEDD